MGESPPGSSGSDVDFIPSPEEVRRLSFSSPRGSGKKQRRSKGSRSAMRGSYKGGGKGGQRGDRPAGSAIEYVLPAQIAEKVRAGQLDPRDWGRIREMMKKSGRQEYKSIVKSVRVPKTWAEKLQAFPSATTYLAFSKNRYRDVLADEKTRVKLVGVEHDYINANYVLGGELHRNVNLSYIACQAPLPATMADFWWMVWQEKSCVIVMLTKCREKGAVKAHMYWPSEPEGTQEYGDIQVTLMTQKTLPEMCISTFRVTKAGAGEDGGSRIVYHLLFTEWPDFGVPKSSRSIRNVISYTNLYSDLGATQGTTGPIICHCSAGIGRTGTYIAIHVGMALIEAGIAPDVMTIVAKMRRCRSGMIQTDAQYLFVYDALNDHIRQKAESKKPQRHTSASSMLSNIVPKQPAPTGSGGGGRGRSCSVSSIAPILEEEEENEEEN